MDHITETFQMPPAAPPPPPEDKGRRRASYVAHTIEEIPAADGAQVLEGMSPAEAGEVAEFLDPETAANVVSQMDTAAAAAVLSAMHPPEAAMVLSAIDSDDRVDILEHVEPRAREQLITEMDAAPAADVRRLQRYRRDTAGGIMTSQVTALPHDITVEQAIAELRRLNETLEQMFYVYVVDDKHRLVGVLSMRDLILAKPDKKIRELMHRNVTSVQANTDQEEVARLMRKYKY